MKKKISWILVLSMLFSLVTALPMIVSADQPPATVFSDEDLDHIYFIGDTLSFNLSGLPVGVPPTASLQTQRCV